LTRIATETTLLPEDQIKRLPCVTVVSQTVKTGD